MDIHIYETVSVAQSLYVRLSSYCVYHSSNKYTHMFPFVRSFILLIWIFDFTKVLTCLQVMLNGVYYGIIIKIDGLTNMYSSNSGNQKWKPKRISRHEFLFKYYSLHYATVCDLSQLNHEILVYIHISYAIFIWIVHKIDWNTMTSDFGKSADRLN